MVHRCHLRRRHHRRHHHPRSRLPRVNTHPPIACLFFRLSSSAVIRLCHGAKPTNRRRDKTFEPRHPLVSLCFDIERETYRTGEVGGIERHPAETRQRLSSRCYCHCQSQQGGEWVGGREVQTASRAGRHPNRVLSFHRGTLPTRGKHLPAYAANRFASTLNST